MRASWRARPASNAAIPQRMDRLRIPPVRLHLVFMRRSPKQTSMRRSSEFSIKPLLKSESRRACSPTWTRRPRSPRRSGSIPGCAMKRGPTAPTACRRSGSTSTVQTASGTAGTCARRSPSSTNVGGRGWRNTGAGGPWRSIRRCLPGGSDLSAIDFGAGGGCYCCYCCYSRELLSRPSFRAGADR